MNINQESRLDKAATVNTPRSRFLMHQNIRTTFNAGSLIPFFVDSDIMPGDTFKIKGTFVVRQSTPIYPTMDNSFLDVFFFFVPHRLVWNHWKEFWGENTTGSWTQQTQYTIPQIIVGKTNGAQAVKKGDPLQYMGIPIGIPVTPSGFSINALPLRAYQLVWNDWFRDENVCPPLYINKSDTTSEVAHGGNYTYGNYTANNNYTCGDLAPVYKYKDYFNACLPEPQKGSPITLPIGQSADIISNGKSIFLQGSPGDTTVPPTGEAGIFNNTTYGLYPNSVADGYAFGSQTGLIADLSNAVAATINAQRMAFAAQRILEAKARTGSRYTEIIRGLFGVISPDARQQRPEYLGGKRIPITMNQVAQTSSTDNTSPQGNVAAFSLTVESDHLVTKSFTEHGSLLGLVAIRQEHSYDQGVSRMWSRKNVLDFFQPQLSFLGEQAILNKEIFATGGTTDDQVFGYNERWAELRYKPNINTGMFSTQYAQSLDSWHYGDSYSSLPVLSDAWRRETKDYIDRTLAVTSAVSDQYLMDSRLEFDCIRPLPLFSVPGLLDHF